MDATSSPDHDEVLRAVRDAWAGQPDLTLATLFARLANSGLGFGSTDADLLQALRREASIHPPRLELADAALAAWSIRVRPPAQWLADVTLHGNDVVVRRRGEEGPLRPSVWTFVGMKDVSVGEDLRLGTDEEQWVNLGCIELITRLDVQAAEVPYGGWLRRRDLGETVYLYITGKEHILLDHRLHIFEQERREVRTWRLNWDAVAQWGIGKRLVVRLANGSMWESAPLQKVLVVAC